MGIPFYLTLMALGALDALQPGHAKSLVASCFIGQDAKVQHVVLLGLVVTLTHVIINGALAWGIISFASSRFDASLLQGVHLVAGTLMIGLASVLVWQRFFQKKEHLCCNHEHSDPPRAIPLSEQGESFWKILGLGVTSGLLPCPVVLTALVSAVSLGKVSEALVGILFFSMGMGLVMVVIGLATVFGMTRIHWFSKPDISKKLGQLSALIVLCIGCFFVTSALFLFEVENEAPVSLIQLSD